MFAGSLLLAVTVTGFAVWLQMNESRDWPKAAASELETKYRKKRFRWRSFIHNMLIVAGGLIAVAGFAGAGRIWVVCWASVMVILLLVMMLAIIDGFRTRRYLKQRLPEIRRQIMDD